MTDTRTVQIPATVLASVQTLDELEDWLASRDAVFLDEVRRIRREEDLAGRGKDLSEILQRWPAK